MEWLPILKDHITTSSHIGRIGYNPFDAQGGRGKIHHLFGDEMNAILDQLNNALVTR